MLLCAIFGPSRGDPPCALLKPRSARSNLPVFFIELIGVRPVDRRKDHLHIVSRLCSKIHLIGAREHFEDEQRVAARDRLGVVVRPGIDELLLLISAQSITPRHGSAPPIRPTPYESRKTIFGNLEGYVRINPLIDDRPSHLIRTASPESPHASAYFMLAGVSLNSSGYGFDQWRGMRCLRVGDW